MKLNLSDWKEFTISSIFSIRTGNGITREEIAEHPGTFIVVQSGEENNGILGKIDPEYCKIRHYALSAKPCLTVARSGSAGAVCFQPHGCVVGDSAKLLLLKKEDPDVCHYLFLQTLLNLIRFKYAYGRKVTDNKYRNDTIPLPVCRHPDGSPVLDPAHTYSKDGYVPDWDYMTAYMRSLHNRPLTTKNRPGQAPDLHVSEWKEFRLADLFNIRYGLNLELNACVEADREEPDSVNFVARTAENNGVSSRVRILDHVEPQKSGLITVAGGGSVLSSFYQDEPFYSGRDLYILEAKVELSPAAKLFLVTAIEQNKYKYNYGRQANKTLPNLTILLPVLRGADRTPCLDSTCAFSKQGYIPDWKFMEDYMRALPYGDRITGHSAHPGSPAPHRSAYRTQPRPGSARQ